MQVTQTTKLKQINCGTCGTPFAMDEMIWNSCYNEGGFFYCPLGHSRGWSTGQTPSELDKIRKEHAAELSKAETIAAQLRSRLADKDSQLQSVQRSASAMKGQVTKIRNRVGKGVCPCCNRSFQNLKRHMELQHPEMAETAPASLTEGD